jgi:hypothetical protein
MYKLNFLQYPKPCLVSIDESMSLNVLSPNESVLSLKQKLKERFGFAYSRTFSFSSDGFLALMLQLKGKILVSLGESHAIVEAATKAQAHGCDIKFIALTKEGKLNYNELCECEYAFVSSYIMDTFVKVDLDKVKEKTKALIISNITATLQKERCDIALLDAYKLTGYATSSLMLHNIEFEEQNFGNIDVIAMQLILQGIEHFVTNSTYKEAFTNELNEVFQDNIYYFVKPEDTLEYVLHFGLKDIKAREMIRTLALDEIFVTNGEGCSLGLGQPSRILQAMQYSETQSRWALSFNFSQQLEHNDIKTIAKTMAKKYRQIKALMQ